MADGTWSRRSTVTDPPTIEEIERILARIGPPREPQRMVVAPDVFERLERLPEAMMTTIPAPLSLFGMPVHVNGELPLRVWQYWEGDRLVDWGLLKEDEPHHERKPEPLLSPDATEALKEGWKAELNALWRMRPRRKA